MAFKKGHPSWNKGKKFSEEYRKKISLGHKGQVAWHKGKTNVYSEETLKKMSEAKKGKMPWIKGKKHSEETKLKMRKKHKSFSEETRKNLSIARTGFKHWNWMGGISREPYSIDWTKTLKRSIRERDNYICQLCSQYGNVVHHIDYDKKNCNPDNLINLCKSCNSKVNGNRNYWKNYFKNIGGI